MNKMRLNPLTKFAADIVVLLPYLFIYQISFLFGYFPIMINNKQAVWIDSETSIFEKFCL